MLTKNMTGRGGRWRRRLAILLMLAMIVSTPGGPLLVTTVNAQGPPPVGAGFQLNGGDLRFILRQIQIAEAHSAGGNLLALVGDPRLPFGLRTVDGSLNHLLPGQEWFGAADQRFPRMTEAVFQDAENWALDPDGPGPLVAGSPSSYKQKSGYVNDSHPRVVSNLIVDQTVRNPAARAAAGEDAVPEESGTLFIPNVAPDAGLSAPFNSMFTFFGQFFDHGLDLVTKGGGTVYIPLRNDDPLVLGPDGQLGTADDLPPNLRFMVFTRATNHPGPDNMLGTEDDIQEALNTTTPFVDQNQTYTSHPSHQVFLREYALNAEGKPFTTGRLIDGEGGHIANWAEVKLQAAEKLGIALTDSDVFSVPLLETDHYGRFKRGPNGFPRLVMEDGSFVEGNPLSPVPTTGARKTGHAFLDDIAHTAVPNADPTAEPTHDAALLDAHFVTGDGRGNENVALTAVHTVFHSEHNRLVGHIQDLIMDETVLTAAERAQWMQVNPASGWDFGERLFQAARFVTEMEYQHLVFEEFARKVQPAINVFIGDGINFQSDTNPAIVAEFAHTVYRFGHSMLRDVVARTNPDGSANDIPLIDAFLNPNEFHNGGALTAAQAAGRIFQGSVRQVGNEIDEFLTEALRNNLLGLPLDLAAINMTRGRSEGIPPLNVARRQFWLASGNSALEPYENWTEFGAGIRHAESLTNFIAAYGIHPDLDAAATLEDKRLVAEALRLDSDFMLAPAADTGVDRIDYWVGGLAEKQSPFGGLLGSTFNYVFETQLENLQNADRFYYLERLDGLNLLTQLEANSFAELVMRNSGARGLPADIFSRPDLVLNLGNLGTSGPIPDDMTTPDYDESKMTDLRRRADGTIVYTGPLHVLWNGSGGNDRAVSSEGDDTLQGFAGNDRLEGGTGNDQIIGGEGDDIITDAFGDDVLKGGPGNDAISGGPGLDLLQGNADHDFIVAGIDNSEIFGGDGNDIMFTGEGATESFGGAGDDWIEGGPQLDLLVGDENNQFQNDPNGGHDVIAGGKGDDDYDSEGGDDIMIADVLGTERLEGMLGFDLATYRGDPLPVDADMNLGLAPPPTADELRDRFDLTEALSGWNGNDLLRGDSRLDVNMIGHELRKEGALRITGMSQFLERMIPGLVVADLPAGVVAFTGGNILLGGLGSDIIEGRGGNDLIDGDAWLNAQLRAPVPGTANTQLVDSLHQIKADVFAGRINPGAISIERSIVAPGLPVVPGAPTPTVPAPDCGVANPLNCDAAVFTGAQSEYTITRNANGSITVDHNGGIDGVDTLYNIERLVFADGPIPVPPAGLVLISDATPTEDQALAVSAENLTAGATIVSFAWQVETANGWSQVATGTNFTPSDAVVGRRLRVLLTFQNGGATENLTSAPTATVAAVNDPATGTPTISDTTPEVGAAITAVTTTIADPDGVGPLNYQWQGNGIDIVGANAASFTPTVAQLGQTLRVVVSFTDLQGFPEARTSAATASVVGAGAGGGGGAGAVASVPATTDFGTKRINTNTVKPITINNTGTANLAITSFSTGAGSAFTVTGLGTCNVPIAPGRKCRVDVTFRPTAVGPYTGAFVINSNATNNPTTMILTGSGR